MHLPTLRELIAHTDWSNDRLLECAARMGDEQLDRDMQIGPGSLRRTLLHIHSGERVWFLRWRDGMPPSAAAEPPWPDESERVTIAELQSRFAQNRRERDAFLDRLHETGADLARPQVYRDSKGRLFRASLGDMIAQGLMHTKHHQPQAVNILRRLGGDGAWPELDYMYRLRQPV